MNIGLGLIRSLRQASGGQLVLLLLLCPVLAEALDDEAFGIELGGFPLTLGRVLLIVCGIVAFGLVGKQYLKSGAFGALLVIVAGSMVGAVVYEQTTAGLSRSLGILLLFLGSCGIAHVWGTRLFRAVLDVFFVVTLVYWLGYVARAALPSGLESYSELFLYGVAKNHHVPGMYISLATVYVALRFFFRAGHLGLGGYAIFTIGLASCLYLESRSNLICTALTLAVILMLEKRSSIRVLFLVAPVVAAMLFGLGQFVDESSAIQERFQDAQFHQRSTDSRVRLLWEAAAVVAAEPLGQGITNIKLDFGDRRFLAHNQYVTYIIAGGILSLIGVVWWLADFSRILLTMAGGGTQRRPPVAVFASGMVLFTFFTTLATIEFSGMMYFLLTSLWIELSGVTSRERALRRAETERRLKMTAHLPWVPAPKGTLNPIPTSAHPRMSLRDGPS